MLASYLGMVPSEQSSGEQRRQGAITRAVISTASSAVFIASGSADWTW
jgi:transposase